MLLISDPQTPQVLSLFCHCILYLWIFSWCLFFESKIDCDLLLLNAQVCIIFWLVGLVKKDFEIVRLVYIACKPFMWTKKKEPKREDIFFSLLIGNNSCLFLWSGISSWFVLSSFSGSENWQVDLCYCIVQPSLSQICNLDINLCRCNCWWMCTSLLLDFRAWSWISLLSIWVTIPTDLCLYQLFLFFFWPLLWFEDFWIAMIIGSMSK